MKPKTKRRLIIIGIIFALIIGAFAYFIHWLTDLQRLRGQEYLEEATSPNGTYTVTAFLDNGGLLSDYSVLCTLRENPSGKTKNIYYQYHHKSVRLEWLDDETIKINEQILNVTQNEIYDSRKK